ETRLIQTDDFWWEIKQHKKTAAAYLMTQGDGSGWLLAVIGEPLLHNGDLAFLGLDHLFGKFSNLGILTVFEHDFRHVDRSLVMRNHTAHEVDIGVARILYHHVFHHGIHGDCKVLCRRAVRRRLLH